jgi:hypothetical protein
VAFFTQLLGNWVSHGAIGDEVGNKISFLLMLIEPLFAAS